MTPSSRLRLLCVRLLGERPLIEAAVAILPPGYSICSDGYVDSVEAFSARSSQERWKSDRKRRALARRRWGRRARRSSVTIPARFEARVVRMNVDDNARPTAVTISRGELVYAHGGKWRPSNRPAVCQEPGQYGPSGAADLGYVNKSQSTNKETA